MRVKCGSEVDGVLCENDLFFVHVPPANIERQNKIVYLICNKCRKTWSVHFDNLPNVDSEGFVKKDKSFDEYQTITEVNQHNE